MALFLKEYKSSGIGGRNMVTQRTFGTLPSGEEVQIYHLENKSGAFAEVLQFGAILVKLCVPDRDGRLTDVVLGYDDLAGYEVNGCFFGATIGRSGNRIAQSRFTLDGKEIVLTPNEGRTIFTAVRMDLRKKCGQLQRFPKTRMQLLFQGSARMERMVFRENLMFLLHMK